LSRAGQLPAAFAADGDTLKKGHIYIAPPDRHLLVEGQRLRLGSGARENNARPAIDPMLRSVAICCGGRAIGAVLTGTLGDGASGLWAINRCGGISVIQDPEDAAFPEMPTSAMNMTKPDHIARLADLPALFESLVHQPAGETRKAPATIKLEVEIAKGRRTNMDDMDRIGQRSVLACPDCHGVMWEIDEGNLARYRCHVGHTYTGEAMSLALDENLRRALTTGLRALEERLALMRKLEKQARDSGHRLLTETWTRKAREVQEELDVIRDAMARINTIADDDLKSASQSPPA
jgi:two-component system chemotaxis response regulator CheB